MHSASEAADNAAAELATQDAAASSGALWNPMAVAGWSLLFTPAFGSYLLMRNWETLGDLRQIALARIWFCFSLGLLGVQVLSAAINQRLNSESNLMHWLGLLYLAVWWVAAALPQARLVRRRYGAAGYQRRAWDMALLYGVLAGLACFVIQTSLTFLLVSAT
jgi:hypothetical protein